MKKHIYLDNAATSFPKPPQVLEAMTHFMNEVGANPGRAGHELSVEAGRIVSRTRQSLATLFNIREPERIVFTLNITEAINTVLFGFLNPGDHVVTTGMEHNSVIRPLKELERRSVISLDIAPCDRKGFLDIDALPRLLRKNTALMVLNHASNVCGTLQDVRAVKEKIGEIPLLLDTAQTAGCYPIDVEADGIDFLTFTGHKALMGPQGTGGLYIREGLRVRPLKLGGTGSVSEKMIQPDFLPDALESGTQNNVGIAGLGAAVDFILEEGVDRIREHETALTRALLKALFPLQGLTIYGPLKPEEQTATVSITFDSVLPAGSRHLPSGCGSINLAWMEEGISPAHAGKKLGAEYDILVRVGLHCAPLAHQTLNTYPEGTVRVSMGYFNTLEEIGYAAEAIRKITES
ncbi:MAG: aminotransferase class V-fold PLP-dependent enzyme [Deltaproteobacteria bacterium]|nr:aminotransferase class V-fold PLP-dependent enzyme [Deltaproteobacteria bacterium]MBW2017725.1 aminotransferase class V-fold PLP-dependent enzyme [Deltaproteobacteria bacterium]MBW2129244.1 aminotransferase class V-fold PLP-dependent enzyme [Deltaproteobacteria bacterium]MBW2303474.1 aminotransferase class V-fold PLP-dependent enzyme [Deltaproteobacteria bacterium]